MTTKQNGVNRRIFLKASGTLIAGTAVFGKREARAEYAPATGPLKADSRNPRYFSDSSGRIVFLTGSHTWANLQDSGMAPVPTFDWEGTSR